MEETKLNNELPLPIDVIPKTEISVNENFRAKITKSIGHGEDAKNSLIYLTLKFSFITGCIITGILTINFWIDKYQGNGNDNESFITYITKGWQIIIPIITLALGYAFGKSQK